MATHARNPFTELYLSEAIEDPQQYSQRFSHEILTGETTALFREGNTVLRGSYGIGKTMLLRLFSPEVRDAYLKNPRERTLPPGLESTIAVNVNFTQAGFGSLGKRRLKPDDEDNHEQWGLLFSDLLNDYIVLEVISVLEYLRGTGGAVARQIGAELDDGRLNDFAMRLSEDPCWFGGLQPIDGFGSLKRVLQKRIERYRAYINWNIARLPRSVTRTKTVVGAPLLAARKMLVAAEVLPNHSQLIVTLDQYESLYHVDYASENQVGTTMGATLCRVVNSLLALRQSGVFFKVGVRHYAWGKETRCLGTDQRLESGRDYQMVDLDNVLRRRENRRSWIFPKFAVDVAARRIAAVHGGRKAAHRTELRKKFKGLSAEGEIEKYCRRNPEKLRPTQGEGWPAEWTVFLKGLYDESKYEAKLGEVWVNQRARRPGGVSENLPSAAGDYPWQKGWWGKERREALLSQIASECQQRRHYAGWETLLTLSGANILVFINLCREIWDQWCRAGGEGDISDSDPIPADIQSQAVRIVANEWLEKLEEFPDGATRRAFIVRLGSGIRVSLMNDRTLSYPGHTGFSLVEQELTTSTDVHAFLEAAIEYGALVGLPHTTKEDDKKPRIKVYLSPILCPNFEIPASRTKEPYYTNVDEVRLWIRREDARIRFGRRPGKRTSRRRPPSLFQQ